MPPGGPLATGLALARAKYALEAAGLEPHVELTRAHSVTNEVWTTPDVVVRVNRRPDRRLRREAALGAKLPAEVNYPEIVGYGTGTGFDWLVVRRRPGNVLSRCWPTMTTEQRRAAVRQLAVMLRALHRAISPVGLEDVGAPQLLQGGQGQSTVAQLLDGLERARGLAHVGSGLIDVLVDVVRSTQRLIEPFDVPTLIHGDLTFENVLWDGERISALIDFEWSRAAPPDLELDVFLRFLGIRPAVHATSQLSSSMSSCASARSPTSTSLTTMSMRPSPRPTTRFLGGCARTIPRCSPSHTRSSACACSRSPSTCASS